MDYRQEIRTKADFEQLMNRHGVYRENYRKKLQFATSEGFMRFRHETGFMPHEAMMQFKSITDNQRDMNIPKKGENEQWQD
jgi:uncharacterized protein YcaQ